MEDNNHNQVNQETEEVPADEAYDSTADEATATGQSKFFQENGFERKTFFQTPDGREFSTQAEAAEHVRGYLTKRQLIALLEKHEYWSQLREELATWMVENRKEILAAYDAARPRTRGPMTDEARALVAARLAVAREKGSVQALLDSAETPEEMKEGLRARLVVINAKLAQMSPRKDAAPAPAA